MNSQRRFRDANLLEGNVFSQKWSVSVCLVLCDPGEFLYLPFLFPSSTPSHRHQRCGTIFFWLIPPMIITFLVVRYLVCTRWCSYEKLTSLFAKEEKAQGFAELS